MSSAGAWNRVEVYAGSKHLATYVGGTNGSTYFDLTDWLGTERARVNSNESSKETCTSLPFGDGLTCTGTDQSPMHFTGQQLDSESNLTHIWGRDLSTTQGRWLRMDPAGLAAVDPTKPQTWNRYAYVTNNPVNDTDPTGLFRVGPLAYAGYYTAGCGDMFSDSLSDNCDFMNPFSGMQGILLEQQNNMLNGPGGADFTGTLCGESVGLPCGLPIDTSIWNVLGISPPNGCEFGPCDSSVPGFGFAGNNPAQQWNCLGKAVVSNGVSLALDAAGFIPGESTAATLFQVGVGVASTVYSATRQDTSGSFMGIAGIQLTAFYPFAKQAGWGIAKAVPILGTGLNVFSTGKDLFAVYNDYSQCMSGH